MCKYQLKTHNEKAQKKLTIKVKLTGLRKARHPRMATADQWPLEMFWQGQEIFELHKYFGSI